MTITRTALLTGALALTGLGLAVVPAGASALTCTGGSTTPRAGAIVVPDGAYCALTGIDRATTVTVYAQGHLTMTGATIDSLSAYGQVTIRNSTVRHGAVLSGIANGASTLSGSIFGGAGLSILGTVSYVSVAPWRGMESTSSFVGSNLRVMNTTGGVFLHAVSVEDFLLCTGNTIVPVVGGLTTLNGARWGQCA